MPYDWLRSDLTVSPAVPQEQGNSTEDVSPSCGANMQDVDASAASHSHNEVCMMQAASGQGISANGGTVPVKGALANEQDTAANKEGTAANKEGTAGIDYAPANERPLEDEIPPQFCVAEAKQAASPQTDAHNTDKKEASLEASAVSQQSAEESSSYVPSDPLQAADKAVESAGIESTPAAKGAFASPQQSALGVASAMGSADGPRHRSSDSKDPNDPYSTSFKVQPWPSKTMRL